MKFNREQFVTDTCGDLGAALDLIDELCAEITARAALSQTTDEPLDISLNFKEYFQQ